MPMKITIGALQNQSLSALLEYISPKAVESNGANQFEIKAALNTQHSTLNIQPSLHKGGQEGSIRSGYSANAEIVLAEAHDVLTLPESAIEFSNDSTFVYIIKGTREKPTYQRTPVTTGLSDGINIEIKSGITQKDQVRGKLMQTTTNK